MSPIKIELALVAVLLASCALFEPEDPLTQLQFDAEAAVEPSVVHYTLFVTNGSREEVALHPGGCTNGAILLVYDLEGSLIWDSEHPLPTDIICTANLITYRIPGGESVRIDGLAKVEWILSSSVAAGPYHLVVKPKFGINLVDANIPVGEFMLGLQSG